MDGHNLRDSLLEYSKLAQYVYEEGQTVGWNETRILETEK